MNAQTKIEAALVSSLDKLRAPFAANHISKLPKETRAQIDARKADKSLMVWKCPECGGAHHKNAVHLDYVGHAALTDRLLDTDLEWSWEPLAFGLDGLPAMDRNGGLWIKLTVCGVTRLGYGDAEGKQGGNAVKEVIGDALRNAAMRFGAALDLWHKGELHADDEPASDAKPAERKPEPAKEQGGRITDEQLVKIQMLLKATKIDEITFLRGMKAPEGARLHQLPQTMFSDAVERLENKLAEMAKAETNAARPRDGGFSDITENDLTH